MFDFFFEKNQKTPVSQTPYDLKSRLVTLIILDGFGVHPDPLGNSVLQAKTPFLDKAWTYGTSTLLHASGTHVGLPPEEPGNSEVGHLNIGTGQVVYQSLPRINDAIASGDFAEIEEVRLAFEEAQNRKVNVHLMGILTTAGVHGHIDHLYALMDVAKSYGISPFLHLMMDGRDTPATDGYFFLSKLVQKIKETHSGKIASVMGRIYGMDRDNRSERTEKAYNAMVGLGERKSNDVFALIQECYKNNETDQFIIPTTIVDAENNAVGPIKDNDIVIFFNFREDRARQITKAFVIQDFDSFKRLNYPQNLYFVTMTGYSEDLQTHVIFPPKKVYDTLSSTISSAGLRQLHISETEKFMHISYFFNGGIEKPHPGEDFFNVPSPKVFDYAQVPEMSSYIIRDEVLYRLDHINEKPYSFIVINFANPDMIGHTGNLDAAVRACEVADECARDIVKKTVEKNGVAIIIADHGNCETMIDRITKKPDTMHTNNPIPFILVSDLRQISESKVEAIKIGTGKRATSTGILADVAPTILSILGLKAGNDMTGVNLLEVI
ncbi:2,3-bisphosphoglycerate-independent phosphoglycerate mutase [bacterium]|nr:2,3-bisphosphoglycerate-independent phosphoglycerate mutase [bacterium]